MNTILLIASIVLLYIPPVTAQAQKSEAEPFRFHDIKLAMSISDFKAKHPAPKVELYGPSGSPLPGQATCNGSTVGQQKSDMEDATRGIARCYYGEEYLEVRLRVSTIFVDGMLALIEVEPPADTGGCFEPPPSNAANSTKYFYSALCQSYPPLLRALTDKFGQATRVVSANENLKTFDVQRWESDSSVAEFQDHMCGPWDGTDAGWGKAISEVLVGTYCGSGDILSSRQPVMLYLDKELSRTLATRLQSKPSR